MLGKAKGYGYKNIGFILDRGYFSKGNIRKMDEYGYGFVIMVKGMAKLVNRLVLENKGRFEEERKCSIRKHHVYGITVKEKLYLDDEKDRYFHIYHSTGKEHGEKEELEETLEHLGKVLKAQYGTDYQLSDTEKEYFDTFYDRNGILTLVKEKDDVIKRALRLCGYFCIVTSDKMTAAEALDLYYSRNASEKLFRGDKSYLGNRSERTHYNESTDAKIFIEFLALIVRNRRSEKEKDHLRVAGEEVLVSLFTRKLTEGEGVISTYRYNNRRSHISFESLYLAAGEDPECDAFLCLYRNGEVGSEPLFPATRIVYNMIRRR